MDEFEELVLSNGIRVVHCEHTFSKISHCGFIINAGSRDELEQEHGLAHFIEHCLFKGTKRRKPYHILNRLESVGGELNAYTTKEDTCLYASFTKEYYDRTIELLTDILFNSTFPMRELKKEKEVIYDEINYYNDTPSELIFEEFDELFFNNNAISRSILGTKRTIEKFNASSIKDFMFRNYLQPDQIVFSSVGDISLKKLAQILEKHLGSVSLSKEEAPVRSKASVNTPFQVVQKKHINQSHYLLGRKSFKADHKESKRMILLNNFIGGNASNSRLNFILREKYGLTYGIDSSYISYSDVGVFNIYVSLDYKNLGRVNKLIWKELNRIKNQKISAFALSQIKKQFIGQFLLSLENRVNTMLTAGKSVLFFNKVDADKTIIKEIESITMSQFMDIANKTLIEDSFSSLTYIPKKNIKQ